VNRTPGSACPPCNVVAGGVQVIGVRVPASEPGYYMFYTYVLKSLKDEKIYVGYCDDLRKRIVRHDKGLVKSTAKRRPLKLI